LLYSPISSVHAEIQAFGDIESVFQYRTQLYQWTRNIPSETQYAATNVLCVPN